jgi:4-hydroxy-tetrahydrodipicolinate synthase
MSVGLLQSVAELSQVVAIKNSTGDLRRFLEVFFALKDKVRVFGVPSDELGVLLVRDQGADGTMGAGAVLGRELPGFFNAIWEGDSERALLLGQRNELLMRDWFKVDYTGRFGSAQAIFKEALTQIGLPGGYPRKPLLPLDAHGVKRIRETLQKLGLTLAPASREADSVSR